ncbi:DUF2567 domain-containing protein [Amycolatopsis taiwanensis]|uniref:DUF2567 domain-containing protein n=1 Tax=Amycolatopsis taiwanensis TaxID=342230 RepID=UPI00255786C2|nr:DUF2567 domain-containing protein [Amycolatopsis taiwanensis]
MWSSALPVPPWRRPRVVVKADLAAAVSVLAVVGLLGIPLGWLWSRLAPPERVLVQEGDQLIPLLLESWHRFDDLAIYGLLGLAAGVCTGVAVWLLRERRGPVIMIGATLGAVLAAWLGIRLGTAFANSHYALSTAPALNSVIAVAPRIESLWVIVAQPLATVVVYGLLAGWNGRDDLGRRLG